MHIQGHYVWGWKCFLPTFISTVRTLKISMLHTVDSTTFSAEVKLTHKLLWRGALPFTHIPLQSFNYRRPVESRHPSSLQLPLLLWYLPWENDKMIKHINKAIIHNTGENYSLSFPWISKFCSQVVLSHKFSGTVKTMLILPRMISLSEFKWRKKFCCQLVWFGPNYQQRLTMLTSKTPLVSTKCTPERFKVAIRCW